MVATAADAAAGGARVSGLTITDALDGAAATRGLSLPAATALAAQAGIDLLLLIGSEASSAAAYERLVTLAQEGSIGASVPASQLRPHLGAQARVRVSRSEPERA